MQSKKGFSLVEIIVVVAMIGILLGVVFAIPWGSFAVGQAAEVFSREFQFARLEAIRRNEYVVMTINPGADTYSMFVDTDKDGTFDGTSVTPNETYIFAGSGERGNLAGQGIDIVSANGNTNAITVSFDTRGQLVNLAANNILLSRTGGAFPRRVCVSQQGRARVISGSATC